MINEISVIDENSIKNKIYVIRGFQVMVDSDLAAIYGYETRYFNRQVKNNIERFDDDFMFQLTKDELKNLMCKNFTSSWGGSRKLPYVFTEQGIYMLMTVLKGEKAVKQSKALIRIFKSMKDYINNNNLISYDNIINMALEIKNNSEDIKIIKSNLKNINYLLDNNYPKETLILNGDYVESHLAYKQIYALAQKTIYIIDDYISLKSLVLLKDVKENIEIIIFSDNVNKMLHRIEYEDFLKEYPQINISFKVTNNKYHDRYIILDYESSTEKIFHCGASSKDSGNKITTISEIKDRQVYSKIINDLIDNESLILK